MDGQVLMTEQDKVTEPAPEAPAKPEPAQTSVPARPGPAVFLPAILTGALLWACYFPMAWGWLAWVALVPFLGLVRAKVGPRRLYFCAWLGGLLFFFPVLQWMRVADYRMYFTWIALALYCSLYFPLALLLIRRLDRYTTLPLFVTAPTVWVALEYFRSWFGEGFPWYFLAHTQHDVLALIQISDLSGAFMISFLVVVVNALLFEVLYTFAWYRALVMLPDGTDAGSLLASGTRPLWLGVQGGVVAALLVGALVYGAWRLSEDTMTDGPNIALLQSNLDQRQRIASMIGPNNTFKPPQSNLYANPVMLCVRASRLNPRPELIVWPETSYPRDWLVVGSGVPLEKVPDEWAAEQLLSLLNIKDAPTQCWTHLLLGLNTRVLVEAGKKPRELRYNSALLMLHTAKGSVTGERYDKIHRVPFGEYVPLREWFPWMNAFAPYENDYSISAGSTFTRFHLGKYRFGVVICYEDTDPFLAREYNRESADGPPVHFLVNISNDGWFNGTSEHEEHLAISRFRAVEARRAIVRAVNMGVSAVIDSNGRVLAPLQTAIFDARWKRVEGPLGPPSEEHTYLWSVRRTQNGNSLPVSSWASFKKVQGVIYATVPIDDRASFYSLWGDWFSRSCWGLLAVGLIWSVRTARRQQRDRRGKRGRLGPGRPAPANGAAASPSPLGGEGRHRDTDPNHMERPDERSD
jgi:apolipoprotein N-acyltransferase